MSNTDDPELELELYYLVAKFLEDGPCQEAAKVLRSHLTKNKLIIPRKDWKGDEHDRTFEEYDKLNNHVQQNHLLSLARELLNPEARTSFSKKLNSLVCRGSFSLIKQNEKEKICKPASHKASCFHSAPFLPTFSRKTTSICTSLLARDVSGTNFKSFIPKTANIYSKFSMHKRILGHLASVYCILFDHTGSIIVTGADDNLLKVWSAYDGRLMATFRGHSQQITDITIDSSNQYIASGSLDKTIRVWNLHNTYPIAVLQGHSGMVTSLQFCPCADPKVRYLISTGGDSNVCFWPWYPETGEFSLTPVKFNEKTRAGVQMLCSSFSPGGSFLVAGSTDNYIRVYQLYPNEPEKIAELPNHLDHVDSILYNNFGNRFLSGSRDGIALIWSYQNGEWQSKQLDSSNPFKGDSLEANIVDPKNKLKVTMISWSTNDKYVITAATDFHIRLWDSYKAELVRVLKGHTDEVYILETHPIEQNLLLSAGHDGNLILWDIESGSQVKRFFNMLEGQGHGAIFDCKFSPTGQQFSATDSHGHLLIFGLRSNEMFERVPTEQFFHTDYRPIIRDASNYVLDDQTQTAPHLMQPPYLVDIDGNPYTSEHQMLIPGRTISNLPQRRAEQATQNLPPLLAEIAAAEAANRAPSTNQRSAAENALLSPGGVGLRESGNIEGVRQENNQYISGDITDADAEAWRNRTIIPKNNLYNQSEKDQKLLQHSIDEISNYNKEKRKRDREPSESQDESHPGRRATTTRGRGRSGRGRRGRGSIRSATSREQVVYVRPSALRHLNYLTPVNISDSEPDDWQGESSDTTTDDGDSDYVEESRRARTQRQRDTSAGASSQQNTRSERAERRKNRAQRMSELVEGERSDVEEVDVIGSDDDSERSEGEKSSSSDEEVNVEDHDGEEDEGKRKTTQRARRSTRTKRRRKVHFPDTDDDDDDYEEEASEEASEEENEMKQEGVEDENEEGRGKRPQRRTQRKRRSQEPAVSRKTTKRKQQNKNQPKKKENRELLKSKKPLPSIDKLEEYLSVYAPPEWLSNKDCKKFPYFPQIGDEVYYLKQGHHLYVKKVVEHNEYDIQENRQAYRRYDLSPAELCKLIGIQYDVGPPKMCSLKLELIGKRKSTGNRRTITVRFHDMPNVDDFLVLKHIFEDSLSQGWSVGDRFRCMIDATWYFGTIIEVSPLNEEFITSSFMSLVVRWDNDDEDRVSPWDLEPIPDDTVEEEAPITSEDKKLFEYIPSSEDWHYESPEHLRPRALEGLKVFSALKIAAPFAYPVDVHTYPTYWSTIAFPTDLQTITERISNNFYRRIESLLWEVRQLKNNAEKFNETGSGIIQDATLIVKILSTFLKDSECTDIIQLYNDTITENKKRDRFKSMESEEGGDFSGEDEEDEDDVIVKEEEVEEGGSSAQGSSNAQNWTSEARSLLDFISSKDDAKPFLLPVDTEQFPDYTECVAEPIDISTIRHRLEQHQYGDAEAYIRDFQLMFRNSKTYNTDRRSPIYKMTLRLSALFDSRCEAIRKAYSITVVNNTEHMTRNRSRRILRAFNDDPGPPDDRPGPSNTRTSPTSQPTSPRKQDISKVTLADYIIKKPEATRSRRKTAVEEEPEQGPSSSKRTRKSVVQKEAESEEYSEEEISENGNSDEELDDKENIQYIENGHDTSPEVEHPSPRKSSRRSVRQPVKRVRYGFESDEEQEGESSNRHQPKKMRKALNYSMDKKKVANNHNTKTPAGSKGKKIARKASTAATADNKRSSARSRSSVNYCETFEESSEDESEITSQEETKYGEYTCHIKKEEHTETSTNGIESSTEEEIEVTDTSENSDSEESDTDNIATEIAVSSGVSSRGRVRKAANRFLPYD
ncbi:PH-interacting protein-like isoform X2 [Clytia hemisphaerica]|uniref:Bromo domain-containing protein n=1 Tax=Clytia hemisphaerica TaxID=252671 RepID=A0A7M5X7I6_9CNID